LPSHLADTLLGIVTVNRPKLPIAFLAFLVLAVCAWSIFTAAADDAKAVAVPAAPGPKAATDTKKEAAEPKKDAAQPPAEEDSAAKLLAMFKEEKPITNTLGMLMVWVPQGYRVSRYETTQSDFMKIMKTNPSKFQGDSRPVENVTWEEAGEFCKKLTANEQAAGKLPKTFFYSLPTEAQWDFYVDEATVKDAITSFLGDRKNTENIGGLGPNKYELYDVRGNVWEWCSTPVARGGSWRTFEDWLAISFRFIGAPGTRYDDIGFRCVLMEQ
jgi:formylglycine-generating enzyme required for sulfatase activity